MDFNEVIKPRRQPYVPYDKSTIARSPRLDYEVGGGFRGDPRASPLAMRMLKKYGSILTSVDTYDKTSMRYTRSVRIELDNSHRLMDIPSRAPIRSMSAVDIGYNIEVDDPEDEDEIVDESEPNNMYTAPILPFITDLELSCSKYVDDYSYVTNIVIANLTQGIRFLELFNLLLNYDFLNLVGLDTIQSLTLSNIQARRVSNISLAPLAPSRIHTLVISYTTITDFEKLPDSLRDLTLDTHQKTLPGLENLKLTRLVWKSNVTYSNIPWKTLKVLEVRYEDLQRAREVAKSYPWVAVLDVNRPPEIPV